MGSGDRNAGRRCPQAEGARLRAGARAILGRLHELRDLVLDHLDPGRLLHHLRPAWNNGGPVAISWGWPIVSALILIIALCMAEIVSAIPHRRRHLLLGAPSWAARMGLVHRLVQPDRPDRRGRLGRLRRRARSSRITISLFHPSYDAFNLKHIFLIFLCLLAAHTFLNLFPAHILRSGTTSRPTGTSSGRRSIVAGADLRPEHATRAPRSCSRTGSTTPGSSAAQRRQVLVLRAAAGRPADAVHDHRLRRLRAPLGGDAWRGA